MLQTVTVYPLTWYGAWYGQPHTGSTLESKALAALQFRSKACWYHRSITPYTINPTTIRYSPNSKGGAQLDIGLWV